MLAVPRDYAEKIVVGYNQAEVNFSQLLSSYQAKRYVIDDEQRLTTLELKMTDLCQQYQRLLSKVGISRLFMEINTTGPGTDLDLEQEGIVT